MSTERYVLRPSSKQAVLGSKFTLTLAPVANVNEHKSQDKNANIEAGKTEKVEERNKPKSDVVFEDKFLALFRSVAGDDQEVDPFELQAVMGRIFQRDFGVVKEFSLESCRSMVVMADADRSGKLTFEQFKILFQWITELRQIYKRYENSHNWDMDANDMKEALKGLGYEISQGTIDMVAKRFYNQRRRIDFDDFLQICCRLRSCSASYHSYQTVGDSFDEFSMHMIYT